MIEDGFIIEMPKGAQILTVQTQDGQGCIWAIVNPNEERQNRYFRLFGTGHPFDLLDYQHIGTFQMRNGALVWHLFEVQPELSFP